MREWQQVDIVVTVRAYPEPSSKHIETSCVAGVTLDGMPIRLFPIRDRDLQDNQKFSKYTVIRARVAKAPDVPKQKQDWDEDDRAKLSRKDLFTRVGKLPLEYIPYWFRYQFTCDDPRCGGHDMAVLDWEVNQAYRSWRRTYGEQSWENAMDLKFKEELIEKKDLQFFVGTLSLRPWQWTIVGLYYPPRSES